MGEARFILNKQAIFEQLDTLKKLGLKISYSYKTNHEVGNIIQEEDPDVLFSIHSKDEIGMIKDKSKIIFFILAENEKEIEELLSVGIRNFVVDNEIDFFKIINVINKLKIKINLSIRMKFNEHRVGTGKYFVYGMYSNKVNSLILQEKDNKYLNKVGIHIHRKSQNTSEWEIIDELKDSIDEATLKRINSVNIGGGLPIKYKSYTADILPYIFNKIKDVVEWLKSNNIETIIEPGRFVCGPAIKLETEIIQIQENNIILNTTLYNCALDTLLTGTKMIVENELSDAEKGDYYLIKGNSPTRDDIFRYKVKLNNPKVGDKIVFLNAGAYNYTTDFFGYKKLKTIVN